MMCRFDRRGYCHGLRGHSLQHIHLCCERHPARPEYGLIAARGVTSTVVDVENVFMHVCALVFCLAKIETANRSISSHAACGLPNQTSDWQGFCSSFLL